MSRARKVAIWAGVIAAIASGLAIGLLVRRRPITPLTLEGAVMRRDSQADKELPLSDVEITATDGSVATSGKSDSSGFFKLDLPIGTRPHRSVTLHFRRPGYQPLQLAVVDRASLYVAKMIPTEQQQHATGLQGPEVTISNISVRYTLKATTVVNVGSAVKTFQVVSTGDVPCKLTEPCSPDGRWKAATGSVSLDAGEGNVFRNARVSCIAGPCPFTRITPPHFPRDAPTLGVTASDWSDTATFLVEAEIFHPMENAEVRKSYPVIFGRVLDFTLPASAEGVCIEADVGGAAIVFPLGPDPILPWAECHARVNPDKTQIYRCELAPGYRF